MCVLSIASRPNWYGAMVSLSLSAALADAGIPMVLCGSNHMPSSVTLPVSGNFEQAARLTCPLPAMSRPSCYDLLGQRFGVHGRFILCLGNQLGREAMDRPRIHGPRAARLIPHCNWLYQELMRLEPCHAEDR